MDRPSTLLIACGALANEALAVLNQGGLEHVKLTCLPAKLHNTPQHIPDLLRKKIKESRSDYNNFLVLYGDCGTAGQIDKVLEEEGARRISGAHCYEFFAGANEFEALAEEEPGSFYLTDFLVRHFETLVWEGLGLEKHPELLSAYFGNYSRLVYLAQLPNEEIEQMARNAADKLGLKFHYQETGLTGLQDFLTLPNLRKAV